MQGTIVSWFEHRGFGFIRRDDSSDTEVFLHVVDCPNRQPLPTSTRVSFNFGMFGGREKAIDVQVLNVVPECAPYVANPKGARHESK